MDKKLVELGRLILDSKGTPDRTRYEALALFCNKRDRAPSWYNRLPDPQKSLWAEVRADITVGLMRAYEAETMPQADLDKYFFGKRLPYEWAELEAIALELLGDAPNRSDERWLEGVWARFQISLKSKGEPWTKDHAKEVGKGLLQGESKYRKAYKEMVLKAVDMGI